MQCRHNRRQRFRAATWCCSHVWAAAAAGRLNWADQSIPTLWVLTYACSGAASAANLLTSRAHMVWGGLEAGGGAVSAQDLRNGRSLSMAFGTHSQWPRIWKTFTVASMPAWAQITGLGGQTGLSWPLLRLKYGWAHRADLTSHVRHSQRGKLCYLPLSDPSRCRWVQKLEHHAATGQCEACCCNRVAMMWMICPAEIIFSRGLTRILFM